MKTWSEILNNWNSGKYLTYPKEIKNIFYYETNPITKDEKEIYKEKFIETDNFKEHKQNYSKFEEHINKVKNEKYAISFYNLNKTTLLIIPLPKKSKNFMTLKHFIDNASKLQQKKFWMKVSCEVRKMLKNHKKIWVSTHGLGVPYFHLRIDTKPKYYLTKKFKEEDIISNY